MDFEKYSKETIGLINKEVKSLLNEWRREVGNIDKSLLPLVDKFIKACEGGKRIRGNLVVLGYQLARHLPGVKAHLEGGNTIRGDLDGKAILRVAAAYEILHTAILAHDDIIDKSLLRRGQSSLYQALGGDHRGISLAICLADAGFFLAVKIISEANFPDKEKIEALRWFSKTMLDTAMGQILDIEKGESLTVAKYKTAQYSVSGPLILGAILGGGYHLEGVKAHLPGDLEKFGESLGIAFQIQDDILDGEVNWLGGVNSAKKEAERYKNRAMKIVPEITKDKKMSKLLKHLAESLVERAK